MVSPTTPKPFKEKAALLRHLDDKAAGPLLILLFAISVFPWLGEAGFFTRGEPREALVAQAMFTSGNFVLPFAYGGEVPSKPPLLHWFIIFWSVLLGALSEAACRLPSAFSSFCVLIGAWFFLCKNRSVRLANSTIVLLILSPEWVRSTAVARVDMLHAASLVGAFAVLYEFRYNSTLLRRLAGVVFVTAAILSKGPVGLLLPGMGAILWLGFYRRDTKAFWGLCLSVLLPALSISLIWYGAALSVGGKQFWDMVVDENFGRFVGDMTFAAHRHTVAYLYLTFLLGMLPVVFLFCLNVSRYGATSLKSYLRSLEPLEVYCVLVGILFLAFYAFPSSRRAVYLLPTYPFIALFVAGYFSRLDDPWSLPRWVSFSLGASVVTLVLASAGVSVAAWLTQPILGQYVETFSRFATEVFLVEHLRGLLVTILVGVLGVTLMRISGPIAAARCTSALYLAVILLIHASIIPAIAELTSEQKVANLIKRTVAEDGKLYSFKHEYYGVSFYLGQEISPLLDSGPEPESFVLLRTKHLPQLEERLRESSLEITSRVAPAFWLIPKNRPVLVKIGPRVLS